MPNEPQLLDQTPPGAADVAPAAAATPRTGRRAARRAPQWRMIFTMGLFAATVYAATNGVLRLAVEAPRGANGEVIRAPQGPTPPATPPPASSAEPAPTPGPAPAPSEGASAGSGAGAPATSPATPGTQAPAASGANGTTPAPATRDPAAKDAASPEDTNEEEAAAGAAGRRGAAPRSSDEEAPEYRESADNNISLPVDI